MTVTRKLLVPILGFFAVMLLALVAMDVSSVTADIKGRTVDRLDSMYQAFTGLLSEREVFATALSTQVANNTQVQAAFAAGNRGLLTSLTYPSYEAVDKRFDVPQHQFHLPPATSFLRLHRLDKYGDDLSSFRFTVLAANERQEPVSGLEIGRAGLGVRGVVPVFYQDQHIGSVEFGLNVGRTLLQELQEQFGGEWQILLSRGPAEVATFSGATAEASGPIPELLLQSTTLETPLFAPADDYTRALNGEQVFTHISVGTREYDILSVPLLDFSDRVIGVLNIIIDTTDTIEAQRNRTIASVGVIAIALILGGAMLVSITRRVLRPITVLTDAATAVANGDLSHTVQVQSKDEVGALTQAFNTMTAQLRDFITTLEQRVADRTADLEQRSAYLEASTEVSRAATSTLDVERLISRAVDLIRDRFGLYYVGLFLVDESGEWAVLRAGTGEAGQTMLERGHRIKVGEGMIGWSVAHGEVRAASEAGEDAVRLATAELPETRSEAAIPMRSRGRIIGALTVQHTDTGVFGLEFTSVLQTMADQLAVAIDNARLFAEAQEALAAERRAYGDLTSQVWAKMLQSRAGWGYDYTRQSLREAAGDWSPVMVQAAQSGQSVQGDQDGSPVLAVPLKVRGQVVGVLNFGKRSGTSSGERWATAEVELLETLVEQLGVALESARLYQDTQLRAARERLTAEITSRIRETMDVDTVLQTAVREMREALQLHDIVIRMGDAQDADQAREGEEALV